MPNKKTNLDTSMLSGKKTVLAVLFSRRMLVALLMGYACGLPLHLTLDVLKAWMKIEGVDLTLIGLASLVGLPYTLKFLWAPVLDRYTLPFLGRRRGWLFVIQIALFGSILLLGFLNPKTQVPVIVLAAFLVTFFSASQDIVVDAYRREDLPDIELGLGSSLYVDGYRFGMLLAGGGGLILADRISFSMVYVILAFCLLPGILTTLFACEPEAPPDTPKNIRQAVVLPLTDYFSRKDSIWMLAFILLYKLGDTMASAMFTPFYIDIGFTMTQIGAVVKILGFSATVIGGPLGGVIILYLGINRSLWLFGFFQALSTAGFALLAIIGNNIFALGCVIGFENLTSGMGTAAFVAFMAGLTNKRFTATQYALLTSIMGVPRVIMSSPTGYIAKQVGWEYFYIGCALIAIPGMVLLLKFAPWTIKSITPKKVT